MQSLIACHALAWNPDIDHFSIFRVQLRSKTLGMPESMPFLQTTRSYRYSLQAFAMSDIC